MGSYKDLNKWAKRALFEIKHRWNPDKRQVVKHKTMMRWIEEGRPIDFKRIKVI